MAPVWDMIDITASSVAESLPNVLASKGIMVATPRTNGVSVFLAFDNTVTNTKYLVELEPGVFTPLFPLTNANKIWVYAIFTVEQHRISYMVL